MWPSRMPAHGVRDRLVHVVALDEHGVERRDRCRSATCRRARAVCGSEREHARRVAARRRRLADRESDLALRHREARERVHHQQDVVARVAERLGDAHRHERGGHAHERRLVGGRARRSRSAARPSGPRSRSMNSRDLTAALADQPDHVDGGRGVARDHAEQGRLADARAREDAEALAAAAGDHGVERAHAERQALRDRAAGRAGSAACRRRATWRTSSRAGPAIDGAAEAVDARVRAVPCRWAPSAHDRSRPPRRPGGSPACRRAASGACGRCGSRRPARAPSRRGACRRSSRSLRSRPRGRWTRRRGRSPRRRGPRPGRGRRGAHARCSP